MRTGRSVCSASPARCRGRNDQDGPATVEQSRLHGCHAWLLAPQTRPADYDEIIGTTATAHCVIVNEFTRVPTIACPCGSLSNGVGLTGRPSVLRNADVRFLPTAVGLPDRGPVSAPPVTMTSGKREPVAMPST